MSNIKDERGYNQMFAPSKALAVRTERRCDLIIGKMDLKPNQTVLEIGCGSGEMSFLLAKKTNAKVLGTDLSQPFIEQANRSFGLPNLAFEQLDFNSPESVMGRKFDYVVGNGILHHLYYQLDGALANIHALLNENGKMIFLEPNIYNPYVYLIFSYPYFREKAFLEPDEMAFSKSFISEKLRKAGFSNMEVEYRDFLLPNTPDGLIGPVIAIGSVWERIPLFNHLSQSIFISAQKK